MRRNALEWIVLIGGAVAVIGLVVLLAWQAVGYDDRPPILEVQAHAELAEQAELGWQLPVEVRNTGDESAAAIEIEGTATVGGAEETATVAIDLLAGGGSATRVIAFSAKPDGDVRFRLVGYTVP